MRRLLQEFYMQNPILNLSEWKLVNEITADMASQQRERYITSGLKIQTIYKINLEN